MIRPARICSKNYLDEEIEFLKYVFKENGYKEEDLQKLIDEVKSKQARDANGDRLEETNQTTNDTGSLETISLPWIPGVSTRLKKAYKKAGYKVVFKSGRSIGNILTTRQKSKFLPTVTQESTKSPVPATPQHTEVRPKNEFQHG